MDAFQTLNQALIDQARLLTNQTTTIIDIDSTHSDTYGNQEATDYNAHYGSEGYHPLLAIDNPTDSRHQRHRQDGRRRRQDDDDHPDGQRDGAGANDPDDDYPVGHL